MKYFFKRKQMIAVAMLALISFLNCDRDSSPWIWKVEGDKITVNQLDSAYEHFLYMMSQKIRMNVDELKTYIENPRSAPNQLQQYLPGLTKKSYVEQYKRMVLLNLQARDDGYLEQKNIKDLLDFLTKYYIVDNYVREKINPEDFQVTEEEVVAQWERIRSENPQYKQVPIEQGLKVVKEKMIMQLMAGAQKEFLDNITGSYIIEANTDYPTVTYASEPEDAPGHRDKWLWKIDGQKVTAGQADDGYHSYLHMMAQQLQTEPDKLEGYVQNPETAPSEIKQFVNQFTKESFLKQYKELLLTNIEAEKQGFTDKKEVKDQIKFIHNFYTANLYMMQLVDPAQIEVTDEEALAKFERLRKENPSFRSVPLSEGLPIMKRQVMMEKLTIRSADVMRKILESYRIEVNPDFDLKKYTAPQQAPAPAPTEPK